MTSWQEKLSREPLSQSNETLFFVEAPLMDSGRRFGRGFSGRLVEWVYADHNRSRKVRKQLGKLHESLRMTDSVGLNYGAGRSARVAGMVNLDVYPGDAVDVVYDGDEIPFRDATFDVIISQEVFEHIADPQAALDEVARVAKPGAQFFLQLRFIIGFLSPPGDYWRFTSRGIQIFVESTGKFRVIESGIASGHGTGLHHILVEFVAVTASAVARGLYRPAKLAAALLFYWIKLFDHLTPLASECDRIPGSCYVVAVRI